MSTKYNRIKVADLEKNQPNKILVTNESGELQFSDAAQETQNLQSVLENGNSATNTSMQFIGSPFSSVVNMDYQGINVLVPSTQMKTYIQPSAISVTDESISSNTIATRITPNQIVFAKGSIYSTVLTSDNSSTTNIELKLPSKSNGSYTLATIDDIYSQLEIGTSQAIPASWHGKTILFTTSCTVTVPSSLIDSFIFNGITLPGVNVTWAITAPHTWLFGTPSVTTEKQIFTFTKRGNTNSVLLLGV